MKQIKITYDGDIDKKLDKKIISAMKSKGLKWYAQGKNHITNVRDICFDYDEALK